MAILTHLRVGPSIPLSRDAYLSGQIGLALGGGVVVAWTELPDDVSNLHVTIFDSATRRAL